MDDEKEIERRKNLMHERRAKVLELLREGDALKPSEQAAIVYTLGIEPGIREHMPSVAAEVVAQVVAQAVERAQTCQCLRCRGLRAQA